MTVGGSGQKRHAEPPTVDRRPGNWQTEAVEASKPTPRQKPTRRQFTADYKLAVLREADQCTKPGQLASLLRREGLYWSHLTAWRRQREAGMLAALAPKKRGRKPARYDLLIDENRSLRRENEHLQARLVQAEMIMQMQTKVSQLLGIPAPTPDGEPAR
jgi:transposase